MLCNHFDGPFLEIHLTSKKLLLLRSVGVISLCIFLEQRGEPVTSPCECIIYYTCLIICDSFRLASLRTLFVLQSHLLRFYSVSGILLLSIYLSIRCLMPWCRRIRLLRFYTVVRSPYWRHFVFATASLPGCHHSSIVSI